MRIAGRLGEQSIQSKHQAEQVWAKCEKLGMTGQVEAVVKKVLQGVQETKETGQEIAQREAKPRTGEGKA